MIKRSLRDIETMVNGSGLDPLFQRVEIKGVSIDSRTIIPGNLFIPIIRKENGHQYVEEAFQNGAAASLWQSDQPHPPEGVPLIYVDHTLIALQHLAKSYRDQLPVRIIGITGSNGKTTTKDMIHSILSTTYKTQKTQGNYNGEYGLPLTILQLDTDTEVAILEMGMSQTGEIQLLSELARPDLAIITMIGLSHLSSLGSQEAIAQAKLEILRGLHPQGTLIINGDESLLLNGLKERNLADHSWRCIHFGESSVNDYYPLTISRCEEGLHVYINDGTDYIIPMLGKHNIINALAAIAAAIEFRVDTQHIQQGLRNTVISGMRMQKISASGGYTIINDAWNASPVSMKAAIQTLKELSGYHGKFLIIGDMLELGAEEVEYHQEISQEIHAGEVDYVFAVGKLSAAIISELCKRFPENHAKHFDTKNELVEYLLTKVMINDVILVKGSRGMEMEKVVERLL